MEKPGTNNSRIFHIKKKTLLRLYINVILILYMICRQLYHQSRAVAQNGMLQYPAAEAAVYRDYHYFIKIIFRDDKGKTMSIQKIITIVGKSGSGKTTLVEKLIKHYSAEGKKVSALKSMRHDFSIDHEGKDTWRYREAGVFSAAITNGKVMAFISDIDQDYTPLDIAHKFFPDSDIIIIEGHKESRSLKIEVIGDSMEEPLFLNDDAIKMIVTDRDLSANIPLYSRNDIMGIVREIEKLL